MREEPLSFASTSHKLMSVNFFVEEIDFDLDDQKIISQWLEKIATKYDSSIREINYIFCSDDYLLQINKEYLNHDYYTDIITFDNAEEEGLIEGDIFISIDRVNDNAFQLKIAFREELHRVIVHGLLHLLGFGDKSDAEKKVMREKENACLSLLK